MKLSHILLAASLSMAFSAQAQTTPASGAEHATHHTASTAPQSDGEVRKIDKEQGKLTLRHGPLENLGMPAMTMVFKVSDTKVLEGLKDGDKVKFTAEKVNGAYTITALQPAK